MSLEKLLAVSYIITLTAEVPWGLTQKLKTFREYMTLICINTVTNPLVVLLSFYVRIHTPPGTVEKVLIVMEIAVVFVEFLMYRKWEEKIRRPFLYSLWVNFFSFTAGNVIAAILL